MSATFVDSDVGPDDLLALFLLFHLTTAEEVDVAVTFGNELLDRCIRNLAVFLNLRRVRPRHVQRGAADPLHGKATDYTGPTNIDGLGSITAGPYRDVPDQIRTCALAEAKPPYARMIAIGPLTDLHRLVGRATAPLTVMGGAFEVDGNMSKYAEFNFFCDAEAAASVFDGWPDEIRVVPLDLTQQVVLGREWLRDLCARYAIRLSAFLRDAQTFAMDQYGKPRGIDGCNPHDSLAVFAAFFPEAFEWRRGRVHVVTEGEECARAVLTEDENGRHYVAQLVDQPRFFALLEQAFAAATS